MRYKNVRCTRCGYRWHVDNPEKEMPEYCPHCYRKSVERVPEEPGNLEKSLQNISTTLKNKPKNWIKENPFIKDLILLSVGIFVITFILVFFFI